LRGIPVYRDDEVIFGISGEIASLAMTGENISISFFSLNLKISLTFFSTRIEFIGLLNGSNGSA
jgi:hypothetical protein